MNSTSRNPNHATLRNAAFLFGETPTNRDVLFGKGTGTNTHEGNVNFRRSVRDRQEEYDVTKDGAKFWISKAIVDNIYNEGGRFLKREENSIVWQEVPRSEAYRKAQQALRERAPERRMHRLARQQQEQAQHQPQEPPQMPAEIPRVVATSPTNHVLPFEPLMPNVNVSDDESSIIALDFGSNISLDPIDLNVFDLLGDEPWRPQDGGSDGHMEE